MGSLIRDKTVAFLESNNIVKDSQHGFRNKRSCLTNLLDFFHHVYNLFDEQTVDIIYLDFQKAFDKVLHKRLINKLKACSSTLLQSALKYTVAAHYFSLPLKMPFSHSVLSGDYFICDIYHSLTYHFIRSTYTSYTNQHTH